MKIRSKILLLSSLFLVIMVSSIATVVSYSIYKGANEEIAEFREQEIALAKKKLKDQVTMVYNLIDTEYKIAQDTKVIEARYGGGIKSVVESANAILAAYDKRVKAGELNLATAQKLAKEEIANIRYDNGDGYVWINDTQLPVPNMIMHPITPELNGKPLSDKRWETAEGRVKNLFEAAVRLTGSRGAGFIEYSVKPSGKKNSDEEMQSKLSYVQAFKPWGWVLGSGIYINDAKTDAIEKIKSLVRGIRYDDGEGYMFVYTNEIPYPRNLINSNNSHIENKVMDDRKWDNWALGGTENLFTALVKATHNDENAGYVDYPWNKPGEDKMQPKLSYTKLHKPLDWVVGTGVYIDNIDKAIVKKEQAARNEVKRIIIQTAIIASLILVISLSASFLFARNLSKGLEELTEVARDISLGKGLDNKINSTKRTDEIGQLARAVERLQTSVKMMLARMEKK